MKLFICNLPYTVTPAEVEEIFTERGFHVFNVRLSCDFNGRPLGYGFAHLSRADCLRALETLGPQIYFKGRRVRIELAKFQTMTPEVENKGDDDVSKN